MKSPSASSPVVLKLAGLVALLLALAGFAPVRAATIVVNNANDPAGFNWGITIATLGATVTLRDAINAANNTPGDDTITFTAAMSGSIITLQQGHNNDEDTTALRVTSNITIESSSALAPRIYGWLPGPARRLFYVGGNSRLTLRRLEIGYGRTPSNSQNGGAIFNDGVLTVNSCTFQYNSAVANGGAIYSNPSFASSECYLTNVTFARSTSGGGGGAVHARFASMIHCTFAEVDSYWAVFLTTPSIVINCLFDLIGGRPVDSLAAPSGTDARNNLYALYSGSTGYGYSQNGNILTRVAQLDALTYGSPTFFYMPKLTSLAIDRGLNISGASIDQRGVARPIYGGFDIGAIEFDQAQESLVVTTTADENDAVADPRGGAGTSLREALTYANRRGQPSTITFQSGGTYSILLGELGITSTTGVTINAGTNAVNINAHGQSRVFNVAPNAVATFVGLTMRNGRFNNTSGSTDGGGGIKNRGTVSIRNSTIRNCTVSGWQGAGGGILNYGSLTLSNCTISQNAAEVSSDGPAVGAGIYSQSGTVDASYCTIAYNNGYLLGGATVSSGNFKNCIVAGNTSTSGNNDSLGAAVSTTNCLLNMTAVQAGLNTLWNHGGLTDTVSLLRTSPAVNAGATVAGITTDQRGIVRPLNPGASPAVGSAPDIGAFEFEAVAANAPLISPSGSGAYQSSVTVSITNSSSGASIRYTTDGSTPSETQGTLYSGPFAVTNSATVRAIAVGGNWLPSPVTAASYTVLSPLPWWRLVHGLPADGSQDLANPSGDGIANLLKFAYNMAPNPGALAVPNIGILPENGTAGLPFITRDAQGRLFIEFVRRKAATNPGISYVVETGDDLTALQPLSLSGAVVVSIDATWERVTVTDPVITPKRFGRVRTTVLP